MENIFALLVLISIIGFLVGIFSPQKSLFWFGGERTRKLSAQVYLTSSFVCFLLFGLVMPKPKTASEAVKEIKDTTSKQVVKATDTTTMKVPEGLKNLTEKFKEGTKNQSKDNSGDNSQNQMEYLPGVTAVDVYLNFTNKGFSKTVNIAGGGIEYFCEQKGEDYSLLLDITGEADNKINRVRGTIMHYSSAENEDTKNFLPYLAEINYKNARPQEARNWVIANLGQNTSTKIAGATFTLSNSGQGAKILTIEPAL